MGFSSSGKAAASKPANRRSIRLGPAKCIKKLELSFEPEKGLKRG